MTGMHLSLKKKNPWKHESNIQTANHHVKLALDFANII